MAFSRRRRLQHEQHGSRGSAFFSPRAPTLRAQRQQRRAEQAAHICSATALRPQREASSAQDQAQLQNAAAGAASVLQQRQQTASVPDERRDQRLRERELRWAGPACLSNTICCRYFLPSFCSIRWQGARSGHAGASVGW